MQVPNLWEELGKALRSTIAEARIAELQHTVLLLCKNTTHAPSNLLTCIDLRGNEAICVLVLEEAE